MKSHPYGKVCNFIASNIQQEYDCKITSFPQLSEPIYAYNPIESNWSAYQQHNPLSK